MTTALRIVVLLSSLYPIHGFLASPPGVYRRPSIVVDANVKEENDETPTNDHSAEITHVFSRARWKKKRFLMIGDVEQRIHAKDAAAVRKAAELIRRMQHLADTHAEPRYAPDVAVYNLWIHALAKSNEEDAGRQAEGVLRMMQETGVEPNVVTYTSIMDAYQSSPSDAERILMELLTESDRYRTKDDLQPNMVTADTVLNAWAQQGTTESAERAEAILRQLAVIDNERLRPTAHSYASVAHAWATSRGGRAAAERASALLEQMMADAERNPKTAKPDTVVFNAVMNAWAMSNDPQAGSKALQLLNQMKELHLHQKYQTRPDIVTYNTVLSAWAHSGHVNAAAQAERLLQEIQTEHRQAPESAPEPNTVSYNSVLHAWSKSSLPAAADRASKVLEYMMQSGITAIAPDVYSFTSVMDCWAKSKHPDKALRARALLERLIAKSKVDKRLVLNQVPFNTVLNGCAFSADFGIDEQRRALQIAVATFKRMREESIEPDAIAYGNMIKCTANLMPESKMRSQMALQLFDRCCNDGQVNELVWNEVRRAVPLKLLTDRVTTKKPLSAVRAAELPRAWRRNVKEKRPLAQSRHTGKAAEESKKPQRQGPAQRLRNISEPSYQSGRDL